MRKLLPTPSGRRFSACSCAWRDWGVLFSYVSISFFNASCMDDLLLLMTMGRRYGSAGLMNSRRIEFPPADADVAFLELTEKMLGRNDVLRRSDTGAADLATRDHQSGDRGGEASIARDSGKRWTDRIVGPCFHGHGSAASVALTSDNHAHRLYVAGRLFRRAAAE